MPIWPPAPGSLKRPAYRALAQTVIDAVAAGELTSGTRLPPHRTLAYELGVSVQTVSRAYEELARLGVVSGEVGRGSFVRSLSGDPRTPWHRIDGSEEVIDLSMLTPALSKTHARRFAATLTEIAGDLPAPVAFSFRPTATLQSHIDHAVRWLGRCGVEAEREQVLPTNGNTAAMAVAMLTAAAPGDTIATEEMGHHTLKALTGSLGLRLQGLPIDAEGVLPDALDRACRASPIRAVFLMPEGLGPLALRMGETRRSEVAAVCRRHDVAIIENDAWGPLGAERGTPFAALAPERTFYFTGLTKCCLPGLRIAWLVSPPRQATAARTRHLVTNWMATALMAEIATRWLADGTASELVRWQRAALGARNEVAQQILGPHGIRATPHGLHVWLPLRPPWEEGAFVALARHNGVAVAGGMAFAISEATQHRGVRICLGAPDGRAFERGLHTLARLAISEPELAHLAF
ncbi:PLP-dependent aminotransferase family protein [Acuticoccus sp. I52.16.1]|uniref:MocR-like ectoine utilization transcription factor EhuR n=1 Tax=Acuticoccus sp. I52.16.1 TaxID=2928472 RepID=UPI001FD58090|nr:PLP-dependent aminotransferase family protein [Acuticoccus sp. I52.16.1]UOM32736.1 PLP-dependent aminotransferase family protein [Acuticoccus sp. I52.16.1]